MRTGTLLLWLSCLMTTLSFGDSIRTFQVTQVSMSMSPNDGSGGNVTFSLIGPASPSRDTAVWPASIGVRVCRLWTRAEAQARFLSKTSAA